MAEETEEIVEEAVDGAEEPQDASEAEEVSSTAPSAETQPEGSVEPENLPPPEWMQMLFAPATDEQPAKPAAEAKPADEPLDLGDTLLTEKELFHFCHCHYLPLAFGLPVSTLSMLSRVYLLPR